MIMMREAKKRVRYEVERLLFKFLFFFGVYVHKFLTIFFLFATYMHMVTEKLPLRQEDSVG